MEIVIAIVFVLFVLMLDYRLNKVCVELKKLNEAVRMYRPEPK